MSSLDLSHDSSPLIVLSNVSKLYGKKQVLHKVNLAVCAQDRVNIVGANGSGKSTLLRVLAGISTPSEGARTIGRLNGAVGFLPAKGGLYQSLTVAENLAVYQALNNEDCTPSKNLTFFENLGVMSYFDVPVANLSTGSQKLCALACILSVKPMGLVCDEPFAGIDPHNGERMLQCLLDVPFLQFLVFAGHEVFQPELFVQMSLVNGGITV